MTETVLITGASRGIGAATARIFSKNGYNVALNCDKDMKNAGAVADELLAKGKNVQYYRADVASSEETSTMVSNVIRDFGRIDVLVNNAGISSVKLFTDTSESEWDRIFDVNVKGMFNCCQSVLPGMIHRKSGRIVNVSSIWGICGASCEVAYSASKAAVIGLTKALAKEEGPSNIRVNCMAPGIIDTVMNSSLTENDRADLCAETPLGRFGTPEDAARVIYFLACKTSEFITGQVISPNGGFVI